MPLIVTSGEPAGIGPDICLLSALEPQNEVLIILGDADLFAQRAVQLNIDIDIIKVDINHLPTEPSTAGQLYLWPLELAAPCVTGQLEVRNAHYVLTMLTLAGEYCLKHKDAALVTAPVQKSIINDAGIEFSGHTEFFQQLCAHDDVVMMLATEGLKVALVTTHLPLKDVANAVTKQKIRRVLELLLADLQQKFAIQRPRILVAGLNPHAGEGGHLGMEEIDIIIPTLNEFAQQSVDLIGPLPADTLFTDKYLHNADAVLAMYHDQGLPVLKYKGFGNAANITLGLPIIRTSVDHGTALDLAGSGTINTGSFRVAVNYAIQMMQASSAHNA